MRRLIYSLIFTVETPPPAITQLCVPLDREGESAAGTAKSATPGKRIIDLRIGDELIAHGKRYRITEVAAFREAWMPDEAAEKRASEPKGEGYLVRQHYDCKPEDAA